MCFRLQGNISCIESLFLPWELLCCRDDGRRSVRGGEKKAFGVGVHEEIRPVLMRGEGDVVSRCSNIREKEEGRLWL